MIALIRSGFFDAAQPTGAVGVPLVIAIALGALLSLGTDQFARVRTCSILWHRRCPC